MDPTCFNAVISHFNIVHNQHLNQATSQYKKVGEELDWLVARGTLEPIEYSEWAAPIIAVLKSDRKSVHICGDFHMTVNPISKLNCYPIPGPIRWRKDLYKIGLKPGIPAVKCR